MRDQSEDVVEGQEPSATLSRRDLLVTAGAGALALGTTSCVTATRVIREAVPCPRGEAPTALTDGPASPLEPVVQQAPPVLRHGELVPGLYSHDGFVDEVAYTFDDMPKPGFTERALELMAEHDVLATFFVVGRLVERFPGLLRQIVDAGHELGNHTYSHPNLAPLSPEKIGEEFDRTQDAVDRVLGSHTPMRQFRPPYGIPFYGPARPRSVEKVSRVVAEREGCVVLWSLGTGDTRPGCTGAKIIKGLKRSFNMRTGGVMVFHPTRCARGAMRRVLRLVERKEFRVRQVREFVEDKYGMPLEVLAKWSPKLLPPTPTTAGR